METHHHHLKMGWPNYDQGFVIPKEEVFQDFFDFPPPTFPPSDHHHHHDFSSWEHDLQPELSYFSPVSCLNMFLTEPICTPAEGFVFDSGSLDADRSAVKSEITESFGIARYHGGEETAIAGDGPESKPPKIDDDVGVVSSSRNLSRKKISEYFYMPIMQAAKELNVGLTVLKKRCREVGIRRWPHRKLMSLQTLINNVQEMGEDEEGGSKRAKAIAILEREKRLLEQVPDMALGDQTKRLRQACFKANYKKRRTTNSNVSTECGSNSNVASCVDDENINVCGSVKDEKIRDFGDHYDPAEEELFNSFLIDYFSSDYVYLV